MLIYRLDEDYGHYLPPVSECGFDIGYLRSFNKKDWEVFSQTDEIRINGNCYCPLVYRTDDVGMTIESPINNLFEINIMCFSGDHDPSAYSDDWTFDEEEDEHVPTMFVLSRRFSSLEEAIKVANSIIPYLDKTHHDIYKLFVNGKFPKFKKVFELNGF